MVTVKQSLKSRARRAFEEGVWEIIEAYRQEWLLRLSLFRGDGSIEGVHCNDHMREGRLELKLEPTS